MASGDIRRLIDMIRDQDGEGSGLDADLFEGKEGSYYTNASNLDSGTVPVERLSGTYNIDISGNAATATNADKVDNFDASQTPQPNVIPVANEDGSLKDWITDNELLEKIKNVDGENSGLDADLLRGLNPNQFLRSDTKELELTLNNNTGNSGKFVIKTLGAVVDTKTGLILFAKKYTDAYLPKQGFEGFVFVNRGSVGSLNITQMFKVICVSAYKRTKLWLEGNSTGAYLVETEYNGEPWYGLYLGAPKCTRVVTIIGQLWGDPIFIDDATEYSVTRVISNEGYSLSQNGYQLLPNGLIIQWGYTKGSTSSHDYKIFPIAFPNECLCGVASYGLFGQNGHGNAFEVVDNTKFLVTNRNSAASPTTSMTFWLAIGY